jgi:PAS domain S-box-containing protein
MKYSLRHIAWASFLAAVLLLVGIGVFAYRATERLVVSESRVSHTREVQLALEEVCSDSLRANNARRGFIITSNDIQLRGYESAVREIPGDVADLKRLVTDNPSRQAEINDLEAVLNQHIDLLQSSINGKKNGTWDEKRQRDSTLKSAVLADEVRARVKAMQRDEGRLLEERRSLADASYKGTLAVLSVAFVLALCLLAAEFYLLNLEFTKRERTEQVARASRELVNAFFSSSTVGFAILDAELRYQRVNEVLAAMAGRRPEDFMGQSVEEVFSARTLHPKSLFRDVLSKGESVLDHEIFGEMLGEAGGIRHWLVNYFPIRDDRNEVHQIGVIALDVTARRNAEKAIRQLSARLLNMQDQERRRIAREIHDSLGQYLVGLKITIEMLGDPATKNKESLFAQCSDILEQCIAETRTLSHLLHPPLLDEAGLASAATWFVTGFSQRSGIPVTLDLPRELPRLPDDVEITLFRVLQESLTNLHRHSRSESGEIRLQLDAEEVILEVKDHGSGMPAEVLRQIQRGAPQAGVGLAGMRERVHQLGGKLEVESNAQGTTLRVTIPLPSQKEEDPQPSGPVYLGSDLPHG